jgi:hypothetical protein
MTTATYKAGIYDWATQPRPFYYMMIPQPSPSYVIPGMLVGCLPYDALMDSTLECFYSETCLNETATRISSLPASARPKPLDSLRLSGYSPKDSLMQICDRQMTDRWQIIKNFSAYYSQCSPIECTYSFHYLLSLLISLYGGLTVSLRFIAPWIAQFIQYLIARIIRPQSTDDHVSQLQQGKTSRYRVSRLQKVS